MLEDTCISVVMPVYNGEKHVLAALQSILSQSHKNLEVIIINDGSTDKTLEILSALIDGRVKIVSNAQNLGLISSLNIGVQLAKGKFIARMDADDVSLPKRLETQMSYLQSHPDVAVVGTDMIVVDDQLRPVQRPTPIETLPLNISYLRWSGPIVFHPTVLARAEVLKSHPYNPSAKLFEDFFLWNELMAKGYLFANIAEPLLLYRRHANSVSVASDKAQVIAVRTYVKNLIARTHKLDIHSETVAFIQNPFYKFNRKAVRADLIWLNNNVPSSRFLLSRLALPYLYRTKDFQTFCQILSPNWTFSTLKFWWQKISRKYSVPAL